MSLKNIWEKTFLGRLLDTDPIMGRVLTGILLLYVCIHVFKLEMYPFYMFAMFSKKETPREIYHTYNFYNKHQKIKLDHWDFRKYTVFMNTVGQYDDILTNDMTHPESKVIDKFVTKLRLDNTSVERGLKKSFLFSQEMLEPKFGEWVSNKLKIDPQDLRIEREIYYWTKPTPSLNAKFQLYGSH